MGFMQSYKRLDILCRDMNGIGVTGYIEDMEQAVNRVGYVSGWHSDYQKLKHYRYVRNQIAHEVYATEENMCSSEDVAWLEAFYQRILQQTDPLAMQYEKISQVKKPVVSRKSSNLTPQPSVHLYHTAPARRSRKNTVLVAWIVGIIVFVTVLVFYYCVF